jgi:phosphate acetyltransferase
LPKSKSKSKNQSLLSLDVFRHGNFRCLSLLPWDPTYTAPRVLDVHRFLVTQIINAGELETRRAHTIGICARTARNLIHTLVPGVLLVVPGGLIPPKGVMTLCSAALKTGLSVLIIEENSFRTAQLLDNMDIEVPADDSFRIETVMNAIALGIDSFGLRDRAQVKREKRLSLAAFRYFLVKQARIASRRIVLPEGEEPRTIQAAVSCHEKNIARCVLLGNPENVHRVASALGIELPAALEIVDPELILKRYAAPMVGLRKHKGLTEPMAESLLEDPVVLGTMMLALGEVDGLVSCAINTTANTVRPSL